MNKIIAFMMACATVASASGAVVNVAKAPPGTDNAAFGYGAGYASSGTSTNVLCIGTEAGRGTSGNTDAVFIGASAGLNVTGKSRYTDINGQVKIDKADGVVIIKADPSASDENAALYVSATGAKVCGRDIATTDQQILTNQNDVVVASPLQLYAPNLLSSGKVAFDGLGYINYFYLDANSKLCYYDGNKYNSVVMSEGGTESQTPYWRFSLAMDASNNKLVITATSTTGTEYTYSISPDAQ